METVYVLLPVHDRREITRRFVECLAAQTHPRVVLVLLDDGSSDGTAEMATARIPSAVVLRGAGDWWWAGSLQRGLEWMQARRPGTEDVVMIANDDTELAPDFVDRGVKLLRSLPRTILVAQAYDRATGELLDPGRHVDWRHLTFDAATSVGEVNCLSTRGLFMRAAEFLELGGFRPRWLPHYFSDYEFTIRGHRRGWRLATDPSLRLKADTASSGLRDFPTERFGEFLRLYFSRRSVVNPVTWSTFVLLACPWPWKGVHLVRIWLGALGRIARAARAARWTRSRPGW